MSDEAELALFRIVQVALNASVERGAREVRVTLDHDGGRVVLTVEEDGGRGDVGRMTALTVAPIPAGGNKIRAELPAALRVAPGTDTHTV